MERLTKRDRKGLAYFDNDGVLLRGANGVFYQKKDMTAHYIHDRFVALDKTINRLADYEDTGLEPEEIETLLAERAAARQAVRLDRDQWDGCEHSERRIRGNDGTTD